MVKRTTEETKDETRQDETRRGSSLCREVAENLLVEREQVLVVLLGRSLLVVRPLGLVDRADEHAAMTDWRSSGGRLAG
jgi:hypothetical protein